MDEVLEFTWEVPEKGFRWIKTRSIDSETKEREFLTSGQPLGIMTMVARYAPLRLYTGLFRAFAETPPTKEGIHTFANEYGSLGDGVFIQLPESSAVGTGEPVSLWSKEIFAMAQALELWDAVKASNLEVLSQRIAWEKGGVNYDSHRGIDTKDLKTPYSQRMEWIAAPEIHPERLERFRPGDLATPALFFVQKTINDRLKGRISPRLLWGKNRTKLGLYIVPNSLIGALWLQFAQAIDGNKEYRRCEECRGWFELSPETARTSKLYCSNACRSRAYRGRQEQVRNLYVAGKTIEEAAEAVGTDVAHARRWIEGGKTNGRMG